MPRARVGVVLPTHNRAHSLPRALNSVLRQTWEELDIVVVDDASSDATSAFMAQVKDPRVRYVRLDRQHGVGGARNRGIRKLDTEWIAFRDSDDEWVPDKLERQMREAFRGGPGVGVVYGRCHRTAPWGEYLFPPRHANVLSGGLFDALLRGNLAPSSTAVVRRACFDRWGLFDETYPALEDWELFLRLSRHVDMGFVDDILVEAPYSADSLSANHDAFVLAVEMVLQAYASDYARRPRVHASHLGTIADRLCLAGRWKHARRSYARAFRIYPRHMGHAFGWALACSPALYRAARRVLNLQKAVGTTKSTKDTK